MPENSQILRQTAVLCHSRTFLNKEWLEKSDTEAIEAAASAKPLTSTYLNVCTSFGLYEIHGHLQTKQNRETNSDYSVLYDFFHNLNMLLMFSAGAWGFTVWL